MRVAYGGWTDDAAARAAALRRTGGVGLVSDDRSRRRRSGSRSAKERDAVGSMLRLSMDHTNPGTETLKSLPQSIRPYKPGGRIGLVACTGGLSACSSVFKNVTPALCGQPGVTKLGLDLIVPTRLQLVFRIACRKERAMTSRYAKIIMTLTLAAFALMVACDNVTDYGSNFGFVKHVFSMDTTFPGNAAMDRAITTPALWHAGYWMIIAGEGLTFVLFFIGGLKMLSACNRSAAEFQESKSMMIAGAAVGFLVWFFGFMVIGGEWFLMWQSDTWNGQDAAFKFYMAVLGVLIFVNQRDDEVA